MLNGFELPNDTGLVFRIGRALAVVFFAMTAGAVANSLFHLWDRFALWRAASKNHYLICGLGWSGRQLLINAIDKPRTTKGEKFRAIAIERTPTEETREFCSVVGARLIAGDASHPETLRNVGIGKVRDAFVVAGDDEINMRIVQQLGRHHQQLGRHQRATSFKGASEEMRCCVALNSQRHFEVLKESLPKESLPKEASPVRRNIDLRIFNAQSVTARMFLKLHHLDRFQASPDAGGAEVILVGKSAMANVLLREVLQQGIFEKGKDLKVTCLSANPERACRDFTLEYPIFAVSEGPPLWTAKPEPPWENEKVLPSIRFLDFPCSEKGLLELCEENLLGADEKRVTSVIVALDQPAESASTTRLLSAYLKGVRENTEKDITLACYYPEDIYRYDIERALNSSSGSLPVHVFSDFMGDCSVEVVRGDQTDGLARRFNGKYNVDGGIKAEPGEFFAKYCDRIWRKASENDKDSNRQRAAHELVQQRIRSRLKETPERNWEMAEIEHRRWCAEYLLRGFRPLTRIPSSCDKGFIPNEEETLQIKEWYSSQSSKARFKDCKKHVTLIPFYGFNSVLREEAHNERTKDFTLAAGLNELLHKNITCEKALELVKQDKQAAQLMPSKVAVPNPRS
ncbi:MAG: NAD-binding protein [Blastocatellia bacterium]|nr:NAD-binding protein [Blastocatellia bacterium]